MLLLGDPVLHVLPLGRVVMSRITSLIVVGLIVSVRAHRRLLFLLILPDVIHLLHLQDFDNEDHNEQEPVYVHEQQCKQQSVEEEVERNVWYRLQTGYTRSVQNFQGKPVQAKPKPCNAEADGAHVGENVVKQVVSTTSRLQVDVEFGEFKLDVIYVMQEQHKYTYIVVSEGIGKAYKCQCDDMMHHHDSRVLPPRVHVDCGVDRMAIEAALNQVGNGNVYRH